MEQLTLGMVQIGVEFRLMQVTEEKTQEQRKLFREFSQKMKRVEDLDNLLLEEIDSFFGGSMSLEKVFLKPHSPKEKIQSYQKKLYEIYRRKLDAINLKFEEKIQKYKKYGITMQEKISLKEENPESILTQL